VIGFDQTWSSYPRSNSSSELDELSETGSSNSTTSGSIYGTSDFEELDDDELDVLNRLVTFGSGSYCTTW
jgi:hypothetical protein